VRSPARQGQAGRGQEPHPKGAGRLAPDQIVAAVARAGRALDAEDVAIYLVDYEQTLLVPLPDGTDRTPLEIDATLAGRAFAAIAIQEADTGAGRRLCE
jgi:hypothetical protein